jgi:hypothetical protein
MADASWHRLLLNGADIAQLSKGRSSHSGTVTVIHQGDTSGIWSMATDAARQCSGIGRRLLSTAMAETRMQAPASSSGRPRPAIGPTRASASRPVSSRRFWPQGKPTKPSV